MCFRSYDQLFLAAQQIGIAVSFRQINPLHLLSVLFQCRIHIEKNPLLQVSAHIAF